VLPAHVLLTDGLLNMVRDVMTLLDANLLAHLASPAHPRILVGYSGGIDSHVLLHQIAAAGLLHKCVAIHVNHGISPFADQWQAHCLQTCADLGIAIEVFTLQRSGAGNLEAEARQGRYRAFTQAIQASDVLLLGHHQDDQIETALFYLLRGSGRAGLQGMPGRRVLGEGELVRPLLGVSRGAIQRYAQAHALCWVEDDSNQDQNLTRNYLRHHVIPDLESRWPDIKATLDSQLQRDAQARELLDELARVDLAHLLAADGGLRLKGLVALSSTRQKNLLGFWLASQQLPYPSTVQIDQGLPGLLANAGGSVLRWQDVSLVRFRDCLYLLKPLPALDAHRCALTSSVDGSPVAWQGGHLSMMRRCGVGLAIDDLASLVVRSRSGGETLYRGQRQAVKKLLAARHVPVWLRDRLPLIYLDDELVAIAGLPAWQVPALVHKDYEARGDTLGWLCEFHIADRYG
jgi:tRNA(Ile)-lysidine synthase